MSTNHTENSCIVRPVQNMDHREKGGGERRKGEREEGREGGRMGSREKRGQVKERAMEKEREGREMVFN